MNCQFVVFCLQCLCLTQTNVQVQIYCFVCSGLFDEEDEDTDDLFNEEQEEEPEIVTEMTARHVTSMALKLLYSSKWSNSDFDIGGSQTCNKYKYL